MKSSPVIAALVYIWRGQF